MNLTSKEKFAFGFGALGKDAICCFVGNFLMFYFTDVLFLAPAFVGTLFFIARIWDAVNDPMMGLIVDNTHNHFGKFRTWLLVGTLINAIVFVALFNTFGFQGKSLYIYVSVAYILYGMTYTIMDVPYWSWLPNLTNDPHEREAVSVIPRFFASLAGFSIGVFGLSMIDGMDKLFGNGDRTGGFRSVAVIIAILFIFTIGVTIVNVKEKVTETASERTSFSQIKNILFGNKQLLAYIGLLLSFNLCMQIINGVIIYYFKYVAGRESLFSIFNVCILAEMGGLVIFPKIVKKLGREKMFAMACAFPIIGLIIIAVAGFTAPTNPFFIILGAGILKLGSGFELGVVTVSIADVIDCSELLFGTRNESIICSTQTFLMKSSQAVSGLLTGVGLAIVGYNATLPQQSDATLNGIRIIMIAIPMIFAVLSYVIYAKCYKLKGKYLEEMIQKLNELHAA
ncbi:melibiose:sodium transporter MelB [Enterocloster clostridioformis]|uniref:melibiose:sodium transporter MelB n=10 Tax=Enterocloster clostridioformis TaxID=1531 RepID=UPI00080C8AFE|nr:melibiose:sodium transporter MelB [Enterocloster clostridioformis]ANU50277.1 melibiose:sodium transporter MelB [Lachnoclostridium sp. YL32]OXE70665.1 melibiose:sodium transporter MelB [Enterocloster clostridioformis]QQR00815.1 melibiose:sodium transporter MelB [Enterocloster clostridioformis]